MRPFILSLLAALFVMMSGCGCVDSLCDATVHRTRVGVMPDSDQPTWHRCLFGTKRVPVTPQHFRQSPGVFDEADKKS